MNCRASKEEENLVERPSPLKINEIANQVLDWNTQGESPGIPRTAEKLLEMVPEERQQLRASETVCYAVVNFHFNYDLWFGVLTHTHFHHFAIIF